MKAKKLVMMLASLVLSAACVFGSACAGGEGSTNPPDGGTNNEQTDGNTDGEGDTTNPGGDEEEGDTTNPGGDEEEGGTTNPGGDEGEGGTTTPGGDEGEGGTTNPGGDEGEGDNNPPDVSASEIITFAQTASESAAFEWKESNISAAKVEYKLHDGVSAYTAVDEELIRETEDGVARVDVLGLKGNANYDFKITTGANQTVTVNNVQISAYDRSGYAHFNYSEGVGAYNDDGTLKSNAVVVYVTEETKNSTITVNGKKYDGLVDLLQNATTSGTPIAIRIIGQISAATWNAISYPGYGNQYENPLMADDVTGANGKTLPKQTLKEEDIINGGYNTLNTEEYSVLEGLTNRISYKSSDNVFDSRYNDCSISGAKNVTLEGVGENAEIFQWGLTWSDANSVEVRNLTFDDYTEDACSFEGDTDVTEISKFTSQRIWVHNNSINQGVNYWDVTDEQDKHEGDGGTDLKGVTYVTLSYNRYEGCHKTGLVGGSESNMSANITFHHNDYLDCGSRLPMARQANMHMYNNYYCGSRGTNMSLRASAYAFIENCYFENANKPVISEEKTGYSNGVAKIYNCDFVDCKLSTNQYIVEVSNRTTAVSNTNAFGQNFDTDSSVFYYADGKSDVTVMHETSEVPKVVLQLAGVMHRDNNIDLGDSSVEGGGDATDPGDDTEQGGDVTYSSIETPMNFAEFIEKAGTTSSNKLKENMTSSDGKFTVEAGAYFENNRNVFENSQCVNNQGKKLWINLTGDKNSISALILCASSDKISELTLCSEDGTVIGNWTININGSLELEFGEGFGQELAAGKYYFATSGGSIRVGNFVLTEYFEQ